MEIADDRLRRPNLGRDEGIAAHIDEARLAQNPARVRPGRCPGARPTGAPGSGGSEAGPVADDAANHVLPGHAAVEDSVAAKGGKAAARLQPREGVRGHPRQWSTRWKASPRAIISNASAERLDLPRRGRLTDQRIWLRPRLSRLRAVPPRSSPARDRSPRFHWNDESQGEGERGRDRRPGPSKAGQPVRPPARRVECVQQDGRDRERGISGSRRPCRRRRRLAGSAAGAQ